MDEEENIVAYILRVDVIIKIIRDIDETIDETFIVQKVLMSLLMRYNPNISSLEDKKYLDKLTMD
jgi:hypothetical protein